MHSYLLRLFLVILKLYSKFLRVEFQFRQVWNWSKTCREMQCLYWVGHWQIPKVFVNIRFPYKYLYFTLCFRSISNLPELKFNSKKFRTLLVNQNLVFSQNNWFTVTFQTNKQFENDVLFSNDTGKLGKNKFRVLLSGIEPKTFRLLVRMLYHWATGDSWELRPLN